MVEAKLLEEVTEIREPFVIVRMTPEEAAIFQAYLGHVEFERQREYLNDNVVDLLEAIHEALKEDVPAAPITIRRPLTPVDYDDGVSTGAATSTETSVFE